MMTINTFYEQLNQANNIIKNIKMPNEASKPKLLNSKGIYFPSDVMANILSYLPTPLDHHKKQMKIVNEDFNIIINKELRFNPRLEFNPRWHLDSITIPFRGGKLNLWTKWIKDKRITLKREEQLELISPKLDRLINELKTKKNIINFLKSRNIPLSSYTYRLKKEEMIIQILTVLRCAFTCPNFYNYSERKPIEDLLYSL
jgi:hypothetical protein